VVKGLDQFAKAQRHNGDFAVGLCLSIHGIPGPSNTKSDHVTEMSRLRAESCRSRPRRGRAETPG
jgi:hypothetical protein